MNPDLHQICGLCLAVIPKWNFNTHLFQHHLITTTIGIRHQGSLKPTSQTANPFDSTSLSSSDIVFDISRQGYDSDVKELLKDNQGYEAIKVLNERSVKKCFCG